MTIPGFVKENRQRQKRNAGILLLRLALLAQGQNDKRSGLQMTTVQGRQKFTKSMTKERRGRWRRQWGRGGGCGGGGWRRRRGRRWASRPRAWAPVGSS